MKKMILILLVILAAACLNAQTSFDINAFSDSTKYGWQNYLDRKQYRMDLSNRLELLQLYEMEANSVQSCVLKSALVPGWGQFTNKQNTKGSVFLGAELLLMGTSLYFYDRSMYYYNKYLDSTQIDDIETNYKAAVGPRQYSLIFLGLGALVWGYNIFDVIQGTDDHNAEVWRNIVDRYHKSRLTVTPDGIEVRF